MTAVPPSRQYGWITQEIRDQAVAAVLGGVEEGRSLNAACELVAKHLDVHRNSIKNWVQSSPAYADLQQRKAGELELRLADIRALGVLNKGLRAVIQQSATNTSGCGQQ
ncbi:transposase [Gordonia sp. (in: high G+C Gram-positive bacteria)]|uniref:transposase n=1 Tax=Gordonia sp. (in: high G+C Gram-positive bacteria) TaxID=84139 RepID=UPI003C744A0A